MIGRRQALYNEQARRDNATAEDTEQDSGQTEPRPIGRGVFGNIYDQFRGKVKEAFEFLLGRKDGDALAVWNRDDVGDIDLVWGSREENAGLDHIIDKHVGDGKDFATEQEMMNVIDDVVTNGTINESKSKWDKVTLEKDGMVVVIRKNVRDGNGNVVGNKNWVVTSFDNNIPKTKKQSPAATRATLDGNQGGRAVAPGDVSADKGNEKVPDGQKDSDYWKAHEGLEEPVRASEPEPEPTPEPAPEPAPEQPAAAKPEPLPRPEIPDVKPEDMTDEAIAAEIQALRDYDHHPATVEFDNELIARRDALLAEQQRRAQDSEQTEPEQGEKSTNTYKLSNEVDENGRQFVIAPSGELSFGEIGQETGLTPAPILLSEGMITNPATNDGYGLVHIEARHGEQIRNAGYSSVIEFIEEVAKNYEVIRRGRETVYKPICCNLQTNTTTL